MSKKDLTESEALEQYLELARDINTAMMLTGLGQEPVPAIPMSPKEIKDDGRVFFISKSTSEHNQNLEKSSATQLIFADVSSKQFLSVYGRTQISTDAGLIDKYYGNLDNNWFDGKDDPTITVLEFKPEDGHYWDTKTNALVTLAKLSYTAVSGNPTNIGESGDLNL
ncbi:pyridoxamine 5'-phosphate oxidase family protein [Nonlabens xiamenensis]|uniref:pyridoxamine 5'-phosphate oxidase family protein n=1 Tax=Nonlabens xiamenensis TaxID=2341043 RepID=UPI000F606834|nr:pyridoxamine 5'-phosphate oxidase family protein [Nonlabens xiamenensis]